MKGDINGLDLFTQNSILADKFRIRVDEAYFLKVEDMAYQKIYRSLIDFLQHPMLNLKGYINLELKSIYGGKIIEYVDCYGKNYFEFMDILYRYGKILYEKNIYLKPGRL